MSDSIDDGHADDRYPDDYPTVKEKRLPDQGVPHLLTIGKKSLTMLVCRHLCLNINTN